MNLRRIAWLPWTPLLLLVLCCPAATTALHAQESQPNRRGNRSSPAARGNNGNRPVGPSELALMNQRNGLPAAVGQTVRLPFNFNWGDTRERLAYLLGGTGVKVTERRVAGQRETWTVEGLLRVPPRPQYVGLTFLDSALAAIEMQFVQLDWDAEKCNEVMGTLRRQLESELGGPGDLVKRGMEPVAASDGSTIQQTVTGYEWKRNETIIELFYFAAEDPEKKQSFRTISVHYRYQEPPLDVAPQGGLPEGGAAPSPAGDNGAASPMPLFPRNGKPSTDPDPLPQH